MTNRLHRQSLAVPAFLVCCLFILPTFDLKAQFIFNPPAITTFPVDTNCSQSVAGANPMPTVTATTPGAFITVSQFDPVASGFPATDPWPAPTLNLLISWHVEDNLGNSANFSFSISFVDQTPPVLNMMGTPPTASYGSIVQVPPPPNVTASDNCLGQITLAYVSTPPPDTCEAGSFTRTWTATDIAGNSSVFTQTITISADVLPPVVSFPPANGSAPCEQLATAYPAWLAQQMSLFSANDVSGIKSYTNNGPAQFPVGCAVPLTVTFRATDNCNLFTTTTAVFTTSDTEPPVILSTPKDTVAYCSPGGNHLAKLGEWINKRGFLSAMDSCTISSLLTYPMQLGSNPADSLQIVAAFQNSFANGCGPQMIGSTLYNKVRAKVTVNFFSRDACNRTAFAGQATFIAIDTLPPVINGSSTVEPCGSGDDQASLEAWINLHGNATVSDDCSSTTWTNFSYTTSDGQSGNGAFNAGPYPAVQAHNCGWFADVTFRATDDCGNTGAKTLRFQIIDTEKPVIAALAADTLSCPDPSPSLSPAFISDNCDTNMAVAFTFITSDTLCPGSYTMHITWFATDDCGNTGTATQTVYVRDTEGPLFTLVPGPDTIRCDTFSLPPDPVLGTDIAGTDNCSQVVSITTQVLSLQDPDPDVCGHYTYDIIRTFTATDACGNTSTTSQVIAVIDNLGPGPGGLLDTTIVCEIQPMLPPPSPVDACSGPTNVPVFVNESVTAGPCDDSYTLTRFWQATDVCGNTAVIPQDIHVIDTVPPALSNIPADVTVECDAIPAPPDTSTFDAADNCDENVAIVLNESEIRNPDTSDCNHWTNYLIRREWTATDNCGNARTYTQNISVQDETGPVIVAAATVMLPADPGVCGANAGIPPPVSLFDECTSTKAGVLLKDTSLLVNTSGGPNGSTPVDTVVFQWASPNLPPTAPAIDPVTLTIYLDIADSEDTTEYFRIYGEGNYLIGQTLPNNPAIQCGNSVTTLSIPAGQLNNWLTDGQLVITLAPNGTGSDAINVLATCNGGKARAELSYQYANPQLPISLTYTLDGDTTGVYPPSGNFFLEVGAHSVVYTATDCAGNTSTASTTLLIEDLQPPMVTPPAPITVYVGQNNCEAVVMLPFPDISDNCDVSGNISQQSAILPLQFEMDLNAGLIPQDIMLSISNLVPNAITGGILKIRHKGDNDNAIGGEFFSIYDANNNFIAATTSGTTAGQCSLFHETIIPVTAVDINNWVSQGNGTATFKAIANDDAGNYTDFIDTCMALMPDMTDGISRIQAVLEYTYAVVTYEIRNSGGQLIKSGSLNGNLTKDTLGPGIYTVNYLVEDINGLEGVANYTITVLDTIDPVAQCQSLTIFANPSGQPGDTYVLTSAETNNNSTDNCSGTNLTFQLSQTNFTCSQAGGNFNVVMTVTDQYGNSSTCTSLIGVATTVLQPTYTPVCEGGTLTLFANPPGSPLSYTYKWSGPNGYMSTQPNPVISPATNATEGTYCVTITGLTGCTATGCVTVDLANLPGQPVISANGTTFCFGNNIVLATPTYAGQNVTYEWYADSLPAPVLLGTTSSPIFTIVQPAVGIYRYYVKVLANGCTSVNSNLLMVTVYPKPVAVVDQSLLNPCQCEPITLGTPVIGPGITYMWTGPGSWSSTDQYPLVTTCANPALHEGIYSLIIKQNGCSSNPATVTVDVRDKPATPLLTGATQVCEGSNVTLICSSEPNAAAYVWLSPQLDEVVTLNNSLTLTNVMVSDSGTWQVRILKQGCYSDWSQPIILAVQAYPDVAAGSNSPVCQGDTLQLTATSNPPLNTWNWTGPGNWTIFDVPNPSRTPAVAGVYKVVGKTTFGCADSAFVTVDVSPPPVITSVTHTAPVCADGSAATLQAVILTQSPPLSYNWTWNGMPFNMADSMPVIPNVGAGNNGTYTLVVTDANGCVSAPKSTVISIQNPPATPQLLAAPDPPTVCAGADVTISIFDPGQYPPVNTIYTWLTPNGTVPTTQPFLAVPNAQVSNAGDYFAIVSVSGCISDTSAPVGLTVYPTPPTPVPSSNSPLCEGETLKLNTQFVPGATYAWTGPGGWTASVRNPERMNITLAQAGNYNVQIFVNGCPSALGEGINVVVKKRPKTPVLLSAQAVCLEQPGSLLTLEITELSAEPGALFTWFGQTNDTVGGPAFPRIFQTSDLSGFSQGTYQFYAIAHEDGCNSFPSNTISVDFDTIPESTAFIGTQGPACASEALLLEASPIPAGSTGKWTKISALSDTIINPSNDTTLVTGLMAGNTYLYSWTLSAGGCKNYSSDTVSIFAFAPEQAMVLRQVIDTCYVKSLQLNAVQGQQVSGYWTQPQGQIDLIGFHIVDPLSPNTVVDSLADGNTIFYFWNLDNGACGISTATVTIHNFGAVANAGPDQVICRNDSCADLVASQVPSGETGQWHSIGDPTLQFSNASNPVTTVCNLKRGMNRVYWEVNNGFCGDKARDTLVITYDLYPTAVPDTFDVDFGTIEQFNVLPNDIVSQQYEVNVKDEPDYGNFTVLGPGLFSYQPDVTFSGEDIMIYEVCNLICPMPACSTAVVTLRVGDAGDCEIFNVITPNDDAVNDFFFISCLDGDGEPNNEVTIFNQYGDVVFHAQPYNNDWKGTYNGQDLPAGTYFYVVKFNGSAKPVTGFLQLQR